MQCPKCTSELSRVIESRDSNLAVRRRRECLDCHFRYTTYERIERPNIAVIKSDGRKVLFDRSKLATAIQRALGKQLTSEIEVDQIVSRVEDEIYSLGEPEISSRQIGEIVLDVLADCNDVAYIRYASVYREFKSANEFMAALDELQQHRSGVN